MPDNVKPVLVKVFKVNSKNITEASSKLQSNLINIKSKESFANLQNVASIPRLYRRTNRSAPKEASNYMIEAIKPILRFHNKFQSNMTNEIQVILDTIITINTKQ